MTNRTEAQIEAEEEERISGKVAADALDCVAKVEIAWVNSMGASTRENVAQWLRNHADDILAYGDNYAPLFTGRYNPKEGSEA